MHILVSNDDGIESIGLIALVKELKKLGEVTVVAPNSQRSAASHSLTIHGGIKVEKREVEGCPAWAIWGTPVDCVHLAIKYILKDHKPDLVVSGINQGFNVSSDIIYSGTVGAAREGFLYGVPAIAMSLNSFTSQDFSYAAEVAREVAEKFVSHPDNKEYMLNVNVPAIPKEEVKGIRVCDMSAFRDYDEGYTLIEKDGEYFFESDQLNVHTTLKEDSYQCDAVLIEEGYITISPLDIDLLNNRYLEKVRKDWER